MTALLLDTCAMLRTVVPVAPVPSYCTRTTNAAVAPTGKLPVVNFAASLARYSTAAATSSDFPRRPTGCSSANAVFEKPVSARNRSAMSVSTPAGATAFTYRGRLVAHETLRVGGQAVLTAHLHVVDDISGEQTGSKTRDSWLVPATGLLVREVVTRLLAAAPGAGELAGRLEAELPARDDEVLLDRLPISLYGGG